eukprot:6024677-Prymnesium_polylepis.3
MFLPENLRPLSAVGHERQISGFTQFAGSSPAADTKGRASVADRMCGVAGCQFQAVDWWSRVQWRASSSAAL